MLHRVPSFGRIGDENAFVVLARADALAAQGRVIVNRGIGRPDVRTQPPSSRQASRRCATAITATRRPSASALYARPWPANSTANIDRALDRMARFLADRRLGQGA